MKLNFVSIENYYSEESKDFIKDKINNSLYIIASYNIKNFRKRFIDLEKSNCDYFAYDFYIKNIKSKIKEYDYISISESNFHIR